MSYREQLPRAQSPELGHSVTGICAGRAEAGQVPVLVGPWDSVCVPGQTRLKYAHHPPIAPESAGCGPLTASLTLTKHTAYRCQQTPMLSIIITNIIETIAFNITPYYHNTS